MKVPPSNPVDVEKTGGRSSDLIEKNIRALVKRRQADDRALSAEDRMADQVTAFAGSMPFVYIHAAFFALWVLINLEVLPLAEPWDESLVILATIASVEAIFLSTFVLISQNRMAKRSAQRAELSLQIALLAERETTRLLQLTSAVADHLGIEAPIDPNEIDQLKRTVEPEAVLARIKKNEVD